MKENAFLGDPVTLRACVRAYAYARMSRVKVETAYALGTP
jgi:hypothetical protein